MIKARNKKISLILVLAMVMTMFAGLGTAAAADYSFNNAFATVGTGSSVSVGWFSMAAEDADAIAKAPVEGEQPAQTLHLTIDLPDGVEWAVDPVADDLAVTTGDPAVTTTTTTTSAYYEVVPATGESVTKIKFNTPNLKIKSNFSGDLNLTVTAQVTEENLSVYSKTWTPTVAKVGDGKATVTAKSVKKHDKAPLNSAAFGALEVKESQAGTFEARDVGEGIIGDDITVSIETNGVEFDTANLMTADDEKLIIQGTAGLTLAVAGVTKDTINFVVIKPSNGIGGTVDLFSTANLMKEQEDEENPLAPVTEDDGTTPVTKDITFSAKPGVEGDVSVLVSTTKTSKLSDTSAVVANIGTGEFTITAKDTKDRNCPQGWNNRQIGNIEIEPSGTFTSNGTVEFTLVGAKFVAEPTDVDGWTAGNRYNNDRSIWFTLTDDNFNDTTVEFLLPNVKVDANATPGPLTVKVSGNAGIEGEAVVANILPSVLPAAEKKVVQADAINQLAGDIVLKEFFKGSFGFNCGANDYLTLELPNGVYFAGTPDVYVNDEEVDVVVKDGTGRGYSKISVAATNELLDELSTGRIDTIVFKNVKYDVDSRFAAQEIPVKISGTFFTGSQGTEVDGAYPNSGSTDTLATVVNAIGESKASGLGTLTLGSTTYTKNGVEYQMDVAPYAKNGRTYMPIRYAANILGIDDNNILWDQSKKTVTMMKGDKVVQVKLGSNQMLINGVPVTMDVPVEASNNRTFLPVRWIAQAFGAQVDWDQAGQTVTIKY